MIVSRKAICRRGVLGGFPANPNGRMTLAAPPAARKKRNTSEAHLGHSGGEFSTAAEKGTLMALRWSAQEVDRRSALRAIGVGAAGLAGALLLGCSSGDDAAIEKDKMAAAEKDKLAAAEKDKMAAAVTPAGKAAPSSPSDLGPAKQFKLVSGWYRGQEAKYYDFGSNSPLTASGGVAVAPIWVLATGLNADGSPKLVEGQHNIIDVLPGQPGYSDLWEVRVVTVGADYRADTHKSKADLDAARLTGNPIGMIVNCPVVPTGSTLEGGETVVQGWYNGQQVFYPDFGPNSPTSIPIWAFTNGNNADSSPRMVEGQRNIIDAIPGQPGYTAMWRVNMVTVPADYRANSVNSAALVASQNLQTAQTNLNVNCPAVSPRV